MCYQCMIVLYAIDYTMYEPSSKGQKGHLELVQNASLDMLVMCQRSHRGHVILAIASPPDQDQRATQPVLSTVRYPSSVLRSR